ncbi:hypothetical protein GCM10017608_16230 [Agromyces luteolus]|nr:hypothetical protein GCM10017608_16230 [Agromyces luteolus]
MKFPRKRVVAEIKPHNADGISDGIRQLVRRNAARAAITPQLLTYRPVDATRTRYEILAADSGELRTIVAAWRPRKRVPRPRTWYRLPGTITVTAAADRIPRWQCPTQLGNLIEGQIRDNYATQLRISLPQKSASRTGADIEHELLEMAEFLRELAAELEAEAGYGQS